MEHQLSKIYYDPEDPGSYGGVYRLQKKAREIGASQIDVKDYLAKQDAYTLDRSYKKRFTRATTVVHGIDDQWQADLADMTRLAKYNDGHKYILTVIDCF